METYIQCPNCMEEQLVDVIDGECTCPECGAEILICPQCGEPFEDISPEPECPACGHVQHTRTTQCPGCFVFISDPDAVAGSTSVCPLCGHPIVF